MKYSDKSLVWLLILPLLFLSLHYFVFLGNYKSPVSGNESFPDWFMLVSSAPAPLELEKIILDETRRPNYLQPFTFKYRYICDNPKCIAILFEEHQFFFSDLKVKNSDIPEGELFKQFPPKGLFLRGNGVTEYANGLFFLIQYSIIFVFIFKLVKLKKSKTNL
jgi:hypothetical protein